MYYVIVTTVPQFAKSLQLIANHDQSLASQALQPVGLLFSTYYLALPINSVYS